MALPSSGQISLNQVHVELGFGATNQIGMSGGPCRTLFGVPSGQIAMSDGYGAANWSPNGTLVAQGATGNGAAPSAISAQAGDLIVATCGALTTATTVLMSGYTNVMTYYSTHQWNSGSPSYYCRGCLQYRILTGSETTVTHNTSSSTTTWQQYRFSNAISSVSVPDLSFNAYGNVNASHSARTVQPEAVLRVLGWMGYGATTTNTPAYSMSNIDTGFSLNDATGGTQFSRQLSASSFGSTTMFTNVQVAYANAFRGRGYAATFVLT